MSIFGQYQTPLGYKISENGIDTYGVNHTKFSIQDELNYQFARDKREKQIIAKLNKQGITENYPQYGTNFWNRSSDNNFGFGEDNVQENIEKKSNVVQQQKTLHQIIGATTDMITEYLKMKNHGYKYLDDYHHCKANYNATSRGHYGEITAQQLGDIKEQFDFYWNQLYKGKSEQEAIDDRTHDLDVNATGRSRAKLKMYNSAMDACADYRSKNTDFPKKYW